MKSRENSQPLVKYPRFYILLLKTEWWQSFRHRHTPESGTIYYLGKALIYLGLNLMSNSLLVYSKIFFCTLAQHGEGGNA